MSERWGPEFDWSEANVATLRRLWEDGMSAAEIARTLGGGVSRNAVIGKVTRLGLTRRKNPQSASAGRVDRVRKARAAVIKKPAHKQSAAEIETRREHFTAVGAAAVRRVQAVTEAQLAAAIVWADLKPGQCAWILGETDGAASRCCGAPVDPAAAVFQSRARYCADHGVAAIAAEQPRAQYAERVKARRDGYRSRGEPSVFDRGALNGFIVY